MSASPFYPASVDLFQLHPQLCITLNTWILSMAETILALAACSNEPAKDLILVHTVQLKPMIKAHLSGRMVSTGISDVVFASVS